MKLALYSEKMSGNEGIGEAVIPHAPCARRGRPSGRGHRHIVLEDILRKVVGVDVRGHKIDWHVVVLAVLDEIARPGRLGR